MQYACFRAWLHVRKAVAMTATRSHGSWTMVHGPWCMDHGPWAMVGPWSMGYTHGDFLGYTHGYTHAYTDEWTHRIYPEESAWKDSISRSCFLTQHGFGTRFMTCAYP